MTSKEIRRWADDAMYHSEPMPEDAVQGPRVHLLSMTADPLGEIASMAMMYEGLVARSLADVSYEQRKDYFEQIKRTHLKAPFEAVQMHFLIEGVTRSFTHQMVRQRTAVYAQESLRFAVKGNLDEETPLPPSLVGLADDDPRVKLWRGAINRVQDVYETLVDAGVPAEDARGLLPHQTTTRLHYVTNLRGLYEHLGNRLCTQAQFEWRKVAVGIVNAIRNYRPHAAMERQLEEQAMTVPDLQYLDRGDAWQYIVIADLFRPICYLTGKCEFMASFDRACSIRDRVMQNHEAGRASSEWDVARKDLGIEPIRPEEWLANPEAAR